MANRLGPTWLNRIPQLTGPTSTGRLGKFALLVDANQRTGAGFRSPHRSRT